MSDSASHDETDVIDEFDSIDEVDVGGERSGCFAFISVVVGFIVLCIAIYAVPLLMWITITLNSSYGQSISWETDSNLPIERVVTLSSGSYAAVAYEATLGSGSAAIIAVAEADGTPVPVNREKIDYSALLGTDVIYARFKVEQDHPRVTVSSYGGDLTIYKGTVVSWPVIAIVLRVGYVGAALGVVILGFFPPFKGRRVAFWFIGVSAVVIAVGFILRAVLCSPVEFQILGP
ncbi:MAG: hypothetical protein LBM23_02755 [Propionibacteriaceae bacterium]|nr:hypothetical protein [Propionibacteriaceae bacterium]